MSTSNNFFNVIFQTFQQKIRGMCFCLCNLIQLCGSAYDQNCITKLCALLGDESPGASRVQRGRTFMLK